jgi:hypothetical protein
MISMHYLTKNSSGSWQRFCSLCNPQELFLNKWREKEYGHKKILLDQHGNVLFRDDMLLLDAVPGIRLEVA